MWYIFSVFLSNIVKLIEFLIYFFLSEKFRCKLLDIIFCRKEMVFVLVVLIKLNYILIKSWFKMVKRFNNFGYSV